MTLTSGCRAISILGNIASFIFREKKGSKLEDIRGLNSELLFVMSVSSTIQVVLIVLIAAKLVQGWQCWTTAEDCQTGQVCCRLEGCIKGSSCVGRSCYQSSDCAIGESCCEESGVCVLGSSCLGRPCAALAYGARYCSGGESCCSGKCTDGSTCIGLSCSKDSDCAYQNIEYCCRGSCSYTSDCIRTSVIITGSVCGCVLIVGLVCMFIYFRRRFHRKAVISVESYGSNSNPPAPNAE